MVIFCVKPLLCVRCRRRDGRISSVLCERDVSEPAHKPRTQKGVGLDDTCCAVCCVARLDLA